jgi:hypothetical protein
MPPRALKAAGHAADLLVMRALTHRLGTPAAPDRGGIVLGWLTKLTVVLAIAGIGLFDAISIGSTKATIADQGTYAAREASEVWDRTQDIQQTYDAAVASATGQDSRNTIAPKSFRVDGDGTVYLVIGREAPTLVLYRWGKTAGWAEVSAEARGRSLD